MSLRTFWHVKNQAAERGLICETGFPGHAIQAELGCQDWGQDWGEQCLGEQCLGGQCLDGQGQEPGQFFR